MGVKPRPTTRMTAIVLALSATLLAPSALAAAGLASSSLEIRTPGGPALNLSVEALRRLPSRTLTDVALTTRHGNSVIHSLKGVLLKDLLANAAVPDSPSPEAKRMYVVAVATDGYKAVFSWSELFNAPAGDAVLVAYEKNGAAIADDEGKLLLMSARDRLTGPRYVKWLKTVEVRLADD